MKQLSILISSADHPDPLVPLSSSRPRLNPDPALVLGSAKLPISMAALSGIGLIFEIARSRSSSPPDRHPWACCTSPVVHDFSRSIGIQTYPRR